MDEAYQLVTYEFWLWRQKLNTVLTMLSLLAGHTLSSEEFDQIKYGLIGTNNSQEKWLEYELGSSKTLSLKIATDNADSDIIHLSIRANQMYYDSIKAVDSIQNTLELT